jgi:histone deacetylase 1/2
MTQPVAYIYNEQITKYIFSEDHPMKPKRIKMTHSLIENFHLTQSMRIFHGKAAIK